MALSIFCDECGKKLSRKEIKTLGNCKKLCYKCREILIDKALEKYFSNPNSPMFKSINDKE